MFVLWRERSISSDRKVELFIAYDSWSDGQGTIRRKTSGEDLADWKSEPIYCEHRGPRRFALTPQLMRGERVNGRPRRKLLHCFPTLRTCCRGDGTFMAMWWHEVEQTVRLWEEHDCGEVSRLIARDKQAILDKLRQYAPRPSRKARQGFQEYRLEREAEAKRRREEIEAYLQECARRAAEEQRRQQEAAARAAQERQWQEQWRAFEEMERQYRHASVDPCWAALGLPPDAGIEEVKSSFRRLAWQHHPDRGGDGATFQKVQEAYYRAMQILGAS